jgi:lysophospholipase L1-like esterase
VQRATLGSWASWVNDATIYDKFENALGTYSVLYFTKLLNTDYTGPCLNVTSVVSGTSFDVGFNSDGELDVEYLDSKLKNSTGLVNTWYDQSGNGNHATSSGTNRPVLSPQALIGDLFAVIFEMTSDYNGVPQEQYLTIPTTVTGQTNSVTMGALVKFRHTTRDCPILELAGSDGNYTTIGKRNQDNVDSLIVTQNQSRRVVSNYQPDIGINFIVGSLGASVSSIFLNGEAEVSGTTLTGVTFSGGKIGSTTNTYVSGSSEPINGGAAIAGLFIKNTESTVLNYRNYWFSLIKENNITPQATGNLIFDGDSITEGAYGRFYTPYPHAVANQLDFYPNVYNVAIGGGTTTSQNANRSEWEGKLYSSAAAYNVIHLAIGTNDIGGNKTDVETWAGITTYISAVKALGYDVILATILPRSSFNSDATKEGYRLSVNQSIRDNWESLGCLGIVDYSLEGTMGDTSFASNTTYYADGTHPTPTGLGMMGNFVVDAISPIIKKKVIEYYL